MERVPAPAKGLTNPLVNLLPQTYKPLSLDAAAPRAPIATGKLMQRKTPDAPAKTSAKTPASCLTRRIALLATAGALLSQAALAQSPTYRPKTITDIDLDAPYVPTPQDVVDAMLEIAKVTKDDFVIDLGCGDGRILVTAAAKFGAHGYGVDIDPKRIAEATANAKAAHVANKLKFEIKDLFHVPIGKASVLGLYLFPHINEQLMPRILKEMTPGSRVVSHGFPIGKWRPDKFDVVAGRQIYFWVVPAQVAGEWQLQGPEGRTTSIRVRQRFQRIMIDAPSPAGTRIRNARLSGKTIRFSLDRPGGGTAELTGVVSGETMSGSTGSGRRWFASRTAAPAR